MPTQSRTNPRDGTYPVPHSHPPEPGPLQMTGLAAIAIHWSTSVHQNNPMSCDQSRASSRVHHVHITCPAPAVTCHTHTPRSLVSRRPRARHDKCPARGSAVGAGVSLRCAALRCFLGCSLGFPLRSPPRGHCTRSARPAAPFATGIYTLICHPPRTARTPPSIPTHTHTYTHTHLCLSVLLRLRLLIQLPILYPR